MGRRKITIQPLTHERNRSVTLQKRRNGLFKKAYELGVLCSVDVAILIFNRRPGHSEKLHQYTSSDIHEILHRYYEHNGPVDARNPSDFSREVTVDEDDPDDAEEAEADAEASIDDSALHDSGRSRRVREIEPITVDTSPPGDNTTSTAVNDIPTQPDKKATPYDRPNKKPRLSLAIPPHSGWIPYSDNTTRTFTHSPSPRQLISPQAPLTFLPNERGADTTDYPSPASSSSSPSRSLQQLTPRPSYSSHPVSHAQPPPYRHHHYPFSRPLSSGPSTPSLISSNPPLPASHPSPSTDPSSCGTPPIFQENSSSCSYPSADKPAYYGAANMNSFHSASDNDAMFSAFMEAIERENAKASTAHGTQFRPSPGDGQWQPHPAARDSSPNVHIPPGSDDWLQVLTQNAQIVNLKPDNSEPGFGFSDSVGSNAYYNNARHLSDDLLLQRSIPLISSCEPFTVPRVVPATSSHGHATWM